MEDESVKTVLIRDMDNETTKIAVILSVLADGRKLLPHLILGRRTCQQAWSFGARKEAG
jgi:hypothetical protein